jgi:PhnB protein
MKLLNPYLSLGGRSKEALEFYASVFGGEPTFTMDDEVPDAMKREGAVGERVFHGELHGPGYVLMATDMGEEAKPAMLAVSCESDEQLRGYFEALTKQGSVYRPLELMHWGDLFGMVSDDFGITWMLAFKP